MVHSGKSSLTINSLLPFFSHGEIKLRKIFKKLLAVIAIIIAIWIITPIPEGAIILGLLTGYAGFRVLPDWRYSLVIGLIGFFVGTFISWKFKILQRLKGYIKSVQ